MFRRGEEISSNARLFSGSSAQPLSDIDLQGTRAVKKLIRIEISAY
jgi:hypothetical protein